MPHVSPPSGHTCCRRRCTPWSRCGHNTLGCEQDQDCNDGHECVGQGTQRKCVDINECTDPRYNITKLKVMLNIFIVFTVLDSPWRLWPIVAPRRPVRTVSGPSAVPARQAMRTSRPMLAAVTSMSVHTPPGTTGSGEALHNVTRRILTPIFSHYCSSNAQCVNQPGWTSSSTYVCECKNGYENWRKNYGSRFLILTL